LNPPKNSRMGNRKWQNTHAAKFRFIKSHSYNILDTFYIVINREIKVH